MMILFWTCTALAAAGLSITVIQFLSVRRTLQLQQPAPVRDLPLPPISILKPLKGIDDNLFDNLASFCTQDYPEYEIIFSLQDSNDPAERIVRAVKEKHPHCRISIIVERCNRGLNPKVNNLIPAYRVSRFDMVLISDSNVMVGPDYLRTIAAKLMQPGVGLVSNLIRGTDGRSLGAVLENLHLNSFIAGSVCFLDRVLNMPCVIGKSMLMRKADLEAIGGLQAVKDVLAEDYVIGREMHRMGKGVVLSAYRVQNMNQYWGLRRFLNRHTRWGKLRWKIGGYQYLSELLANPVLFGSLPLLLAGPTRSTAALAAFTGMCKVGIDRMQGKALGSHLTWRAYLLGPLKDLIIGALWFVPLLSSTVVWRGNRYRIDRDSRLLPAPDTGIGSWPGRLAHAIRERFA
jgi:ceramide glucosyltransferase